MKSDEGIFKMLSKSSIIRNQYENVTPLQIKNLKGHLLMAFFFEFYKINLCQNVTVVNLLKTQVLTKNQN